MTLSPRAIRRTKEWLVMALTGLATLLSVFALVLITVQVFTRGLPFLNLSFLLTPENVPPKAGLGIFQAVIGTVLISFLATVIAFPFALGTAIYMKRYAPRSRLKSAFEFLLEALSGTPSIIVGVFGLIVLSIYLKPITGGWSLLAGSLALGILTLPVIERSVESAIDTINLEIEEGSYALGATKWQTIRGITIPGALSGILSGVILGFGRAAEESAVVVLTAGYTIFLPEIGVRHNPALFQGIQVYPFQDVIGTLPIFIYRTYSMSQVIQPGAGFAAAFVLICVVLVINLAARGVIYLGMNSRGGSSFVSHLDRLLSMRRIDRVVEPVGSSRDDETNCPLQELEREEGERLMAKGKERPQGKWGQRP